MTTTIAHEPRATVAAKGIDRPIAVTRHRIDQVLIGLGTAVTAVLLVAGALLMWGNQFATDYVVDELSSQNITFPERTALIEEGRDDLASFGGEQVNTGGEAEAYASYIDGHLTNIGGGLSYAELGGPERAAKAAVVEATESGASESEIAALQEEASALTGQRDSIFKGEMLRGTLLNAYAWSTMGRIAGIAAVVAFVGAGVMALLSAAGVVHVRRAKA